MHWLDRQEALVGLLGYFSMALCGDAAEDGGWALSFIHDRITLPPWPALDEIAIRIVPGAHKSLNAVHPLSPSVSMPA